VIFVRTARRYRTIEIQAASHAITAADPLPATCVRPRSDHLRQLTCTLTWPNSGGRHPVVRIIGYGALLGCRDPSRSRHLIILIGACSGENVCQKALRRSCYGAL
jgi:hypothetical protein